MRECFFLPVEWCVQVSVSSFETWFPKPSTMIGEIGLYRWNEPILNTTHMIYMKVLVGFQWLQVVPNTCWYRSWVWALCNVMVMHPVLKMNHSQLAKVLLQKPFEKQNGNCGLQHAEIDEFLHAFCPGMGDTCLLGSKSLWSNVPIAEIGCPTWCCEWFRVFYRSPGQQSLLSENIISAKLKDHVFIFDEPEGKYSQEDSFSKKPILRALEPHGTFSSKPSASRHPFRS